MKNPASTGVTAADPAEVIGRAADDPCMGIGTMPAQSMIVEEAPSRSGEASASKALGVAMMLGSALCFSAVGLLVKWVAPRISPYQTVLVRTVVMQVLLLGGGLASKSLSLGTHRGLLVLRGFLGGLAMCFWFYAISYMPLGEALVLGHTAPGFTAVFAAIFLREAFTGRKTAALLLMFAGVVLILRPGFGVFRPVALAGLAGGMLAGAAYTALRKLSRLEDTTTILLYFGAMTILVSAPPAISSWTSPTSEEWKALASIGLLSAGAQVLMTMGYRVLEAAEATVLNSSSIVLSAAAAYCIFGESLHPASIAGMTAVVAAALIASGAGENFFRNKPKFPSSKVVEKGEGAQGPLKVSQDDHGSGH